MGEAYLKMLRPFYMIQSNKNGNLVAAFELLF